MRKKEKRERKKHDHGIRKFIPYPVPICMDIAWVYL